MYSLKNIDVSVEKITADFYTPEWGTVGFFGFEIPGFKTHTVGRVTITATTATDENGNDIENQINPPELRALRTEMKYRAAIPRPIVAAFSLCCLLLLVCVLVRLFVGANPNTDAQMQDALLPVLVVSGVIVSGLAIAVVAYVLFDGLLKGAAFYAPTLTVTREISAGETKKHFAFRSARLSPGEKPRLLLPGNFAGNLREMCKPARLIFVLPSATEREKEQYVSDVNSAKFSRENIIVYPPIGQVWGYMRWGGQVSDFSIEAHPVDMACDWPYQEMEVAGERKYLACLEAWCRDVAKNRIFFLRRAASDDQTAIENFTKILTSCLFVLFALPCFSQVSEKVAALPEAQTVPEKGATVSYIFQKGVKERFADGSKTIYELLRVPGFNDNEETGNLRGIVVSVGGVLKEKYLPRKAAPVSAFPIQENGRQTVFAFGDSLRNIATAEQAGKKAILTIRQFGSPGGPFGQVVIICKALWPIAALLIALLWYITTTAAGEIDRYSYFSDLFKKLREISAFALFWVCFVCSLLILSTRFFALLGDGEFTILNAAELAGMAFLCYLASSRIIRNAPGAKVAGRFDNGLVRRD